MINNFIRTVPLYSQLFIALRATLVFLVLCGLIYTGVVTFLGGLLFPHQATGSLIEYDGRIIGSSLVGQPFVSPQYFYGRPSNANYDPTVSAGSNLAPSNPKLRERVLAESAKIQAKEGVITEAIPVDLLAASGAGLDPHISLEAARLQAPRVAVARDIKVEKVLDVIKHYTQEAQWGIFGQTRVNVLLVNLALDQQTIKLKKHI